MANRVVAQEGTLQILTERLTLGPNWTLCLYVADLAQAETDTAATYTAHEAAFPGYARRTLFKGIAADKWSAPVLKPPSGTPPWSSRTLVAHSQYQTPQTWVSAGGTPTQTVYGYFLLGSLSNKLIWAEAFDVPAVMTLASNLTFTPTDESG